MSRKLSPVSFTPTLTAGAYSANDVLFVTTEVTGALPKYGGTGIVRAINVYDKDDQAVNMTLYFLRSNVALGTLNSAISITDANLIEITGVADVNTWEDMIGSQLGVESGLEIPLVGGTGKSIWVAGKTDGTPTHTASGITIELWIEDPNF